MKAYLQLLIIGGMILFTSCQKGISSSLEDDNVSGNGMQAVSARITGGDWKFTTAWIKYSDGEIDSSYEDECKWDDLYKYESNGDATFVHGALPCGTDPADGKFANWELLKDGTELKEVYTRDMWSETEGSVVEYKVEFISNHKLTLSRILIEPGKSFIQYSTYTK